MPREVPLKERLVDRDVLDAHNALVPLDLDDAVHEQEGIAVGQPIHDAADVHCGGPQALRGAGQGACQGDVAAVARPGGDDVGANAGTGEGEVAHDVRGLVAYELVRPAQLAAVREAVLVQHDRVRARCALDQPLRLERRDLVRKPEGTGGRELPRKRVGRDLVRPHLPPDERVGPFDRDGETECRGGSDHVAGIALGDGEGCLHGEHDRLASDVTRVRARERLVVRLHAAVEDRQLRPGKLDGEVVDLVRRDGREQVLDRVDRGLAPADRGAPLDRLHLGEPRPHLGPSRQVGAAEHDALTGGGRQERRFGRGAGVQPRAPYRGRLADGAPSGGTHGQSAPGPRARSRSSPGDTEPPARGSTRGGRAPGSP